ncbi:hypothetical protein [Gordonia sp. i37]|uniref:hypothetical protein n=1 Tax=Gordonia sp. i37 TaxID=1961707 RepID=UPI0009CB4743|nr:hypothetical protein [Gordonia sp. i37]OPX14329.1 hypothetical protein B1964_15685 [Gordonia sp. i37]
MSTHRELPKRGDVVSAHRTPEGRTEIRLHDLPFTFHVRSGTDADGPFIRELTVVADEGATVDYHALRAIPARRLAYTAVQTAARELCDLGVEAVGYTLDASVRPDDADPRVWEVSQRALIAVSNGLPVRATVAEEMHLTKATVDRLIKKAKDAGYLDATDLPKRPQPRQKDATR